MSYIRLQGVTKEKKMKITRYYCDACKKEIDKRLPCSNARYELPKFDSLNKVYPTSDLMLCDDCALKIATLIKELGKVKD